MSRPASRVARGEGRRVLNHRAAQKDEYQQIFFRNHCLKSISSVFLLHLTGAAAWPRSELDRRWIVGGSHMSRQRKQARPRSCNHRVPSSLSDDGSPAPNSLSLPSIALYTIPISHFAFALTRNSSIASLPRPPGHPCLITSRVCFVASPTYMFALGPRSPSPYHAFSEL